MRTTAIILAASAFAFSPASAAELVTNGGFETGDFSGFELTGDGFAGVFFNPPGGVPPELENFRAAFNGGSINLFQDIATVAGQSYRFGFTNEVDGGDFPNSFSAAFGGSTVYSQANSPGQAFIARSFNVVATSATTRLNFNFTSDNGFQNFDNVTLAAVPEPATWGLMILGFGVVGGSMRYRKRSTSLAFAVA